MKNLHPHWLDDAEVQTLLDAFARAGQSIRFVGGCVRDALLGRLGGDIDVATPAAPDTTLALLAAAGIKAMPTGLQHGTVTAVIEGRHFEITTLREDAACDGRHAEVRFTDDWKRDASRRDFTLNALYLDAQGQVYDYFGGQEDAHAGRIRFIGDAQGRIREDYLRILRFFRFYATHGSPPPDAEALAACKALAHGVENLSGERIQAEMFKLLAAPQPLDAVLLMEQHEVLQHLLPTDPCIPDFATLLACAAPADPMLRLIALMDKAHETEVMALAGRWKFSAAQRERLYHGVTCTTPPRITLPDAKAYLRRHGQVYYQDWLWRAQVAEATFPEGFASLYALPHTWEIPQLPVRGHDLLERGIPQGEVLGEKLKQLEHAWEASGYTLTKEALLAMVKSA